MPLYFGLTRDNLRVIWSTGELDDLENLDKCQLSKIKHIICDLHLSGIVDTSDSKIIITKIMGIVNKLNENFETGSIYFWINSKYINEHSGIKNDLQTALNIVCPSTYVVAAFREKNAITEEQKKELLDVSLLSHIKEQVIKKHLELERCLNEKINVQENMKEIILKGLTFSSKQKAIKKTFNLEGHNEKINRLNESRNYIAHNEINSLSDLTGIKNINRKAVRIFDNFSDLTAYITDIDELIENVKNAPPIE